jgi:V8-like Glu-specific endopeptidase
VVSLVAGAIAPSPATDKSMLRSVEGNAQRRGVQPPDQRRLDREAAWFRQKRPLYTKENRQDFTQIRDETIKNQARAAVALFRSAALTNQPGGTLHLTAKSLAEIYSLCPDQQFSNQLVGAFCSGILIGQDRILTAGHCIGEVSGRVETPKLDHIRFVFGYFTQDSASAGRADFQQQQVYTGTRIVSGAVPPKNGRAADWSIVQIDRPVPNEIASAVTATAKSKIADAAPVYVLGYPSGLPLKYATAAKVIDSRNSSYFVTNLNTFEGNSGSGVYSGFSNELVGLLARGDPTDYYWDTSQKCSRPYMCPKAGCSGEDVIRIEQLNLAK